MKSSSPFPSTPLPIFLGISQESGTIYPSATLSSLIGCIIPIIALIYLSVLSVVYRHAQRNPRPLSKSSGIRVQRYAPIVYIFVVCSSLVEMGLASWVLLQYRFHHNFPNTKVRTGTILLLFSASWTTLTAGAYSILFIHPTWSKHPLSSVGTQAIWVFVTLVLWIIGTGLLNGAVPSLLVRGQCYGIVYCGHIQSLFGEQP
ncbi:hypothetical protein L208DRAFT_1264633 [Tricholoma matsutake]|nr:hypothetical protein L208DRAFT_1264633 [Tricholoma matsutake 945]